MAEKELEALIEKKLPMSQQCDLVANKFNSFLVALRGMLQHVEGGDPSSLFSTGETNLECWVRFWADQYKRGMDLLEYGPIGNP